MNKRTNLQKTRNAVGAGFHPCPKQENVEMNLATNGGITLIALVITIIVMLILAAVTISMAINGGLFNYAKQASEETINARDKESTLGSGIAGGQRIEDWVTGGESLVAGITIPEGGVYLRMSADFTEEKGKAYYSSITTAEEQIIEGLLVQNLGAPVGTKMGDMFTKEGEIPPEDVQVMDCYLYGDYIYAYNFPNPNAGGFIDGWNGQVWNRAKNSYDDVLNSINGVPLTNMFYTYVNCTSLTTAPRIPNTIIDMEGAFCNCTSLLTAPTIPNGVTSLVETFEGCTSLTTVPTLPNSVTEMHRTYCACTSLVTAPTLPNNVLDIAQAFWACTSLVTAPTIPASVTTMDEAFYGCTSLTGRITVNANPTNSYSDCFNGTVEPIYLIGTSTMLAELAATTGLTENNNVTYQH